MNTRFLVHTILAAASLACFNAAAADLKDVYDARAHERSADP